MSVIRAELEIWFINSIGIKVIFVPKVCACCFIQCKFQMSSVYLLFLCEQNQHSVIRVIFVM